MPREDVVALYSSLVNLALKCYPGRIDYVNTAFGSIVDFFTGAVGTVEGGDTKQTTVVYVSVVCALKLDYLYVQQ